jgi:hypothetical protein
MPQPRSTREGYVRTISKAIGTDVFLARFALLKALDQLDDEHLYRLAVELEDYIEPGLGKAGDRYAKLVRERFSG